MLTALNPRFIIPRCPNQVAVPGIHDLRPEVLPGRAAVRASVVLRQGARLQPQRAWQEDTQRRLQADVPGPLPGRERVRLQVRLL